MLAEIVVVGLEVIARLRQQAALMSSNPFIPFTPNNQFVFKDRTACLDHRRWETRNGEVS
jgi:hypothetical protein